MGLLNIFFSAFSAVRMAVGSEQEKRKYRMKGCMKTRKENAVRGLFFT